MNGPIGIRATPGREADERPDDRQQPADEHRRVAVALEEPVGELDLVRPDQQVAAVALEERPAAVRPDGVGDERPERVPDRRDDRPRSRSSTAAGERLDLASGRRRGSRRTGRISSEGSGTIADSIAIATMTPT